MSVICEGLLGEAWALSWSCHAWPSIACKIRFHDSWGSLTTMCDGSRNEKMQIVDFTILV